MTNWTPDGHRESIEETTENTDPLKKWGVDEDDGIQVVEDDYEKKFEELLREEGGIEVNNTLSKPVLVKTKHRTMKTSKINFTRSTGGSRLSKLIGNDNDVQL